MNLVHFDLLPWSALLTHIKTDFRLFQYKAFRYPIFCRFVFFFFSKIEVGGISTWHLVRSLIKKKKVTAWIIFSVPIHRVLLYYRIMYTPCWLCLELGLVPPTLCLEHITERTQHAGTAMYPVTQPIFVLCLT